MSLELDIRKQLGNFQLHAQLVHQSGVTGILGASGSGKSLTLQAIAGVVRPDEGRIVLDGEVLFDSRKRINLSPQKRRVGYLFQNYALFPTMTVAGNIACGAVHISDRSLRKAAVQKWIRDLDLNGLENHYPAQLSGGQQQRTALARVLIGDPRILMLDEPFSALDSHLRERIAADLGKLLHTMEKNTILVTHNRDEAYRLCGSLAIMSGGTILEAGPVHELFDAPETRTAAMLTGCKNLGRAERSGPFQIAVPAWGVSFHTNKEVPAPAGAAGIRAHYFSPDISENRFPIRITNIVEEPFAWIAEFRYAAQKADTPSLWWRVSKQVCPQKPLDIPALGIRPADVLVLRDR